MNNASWQARRLREAACEWAAHLHDEPKDVQDRAGKTRWYRLAEAAYNFARSEGFIRGIPAERVASTRKRRKA